MILQLDIPDDMQELLKDRAYLMHMPFETYIEELIMGSIRMEKQFNEWDAEHKSRRQLCTSDAAIIDFTHKELTTDRDVIELHEVNSEISLN